MADTLFGMMPEDIQAQRQAAAQQQAMQYAQMKPAEQVNYGGYMAGSQLGTALGGMMGAKDPVLEKATMANKLMQETDMNDLDSVKNLVMQLNKNGLQREAMSLLPRIDKLSEAAAERQTKKDVAAGKQKDFGQQLIIGGKYEPETVAKFLETGDYTVLKADPRSKANLTGPERMLDHVADVSTRLAANETVPEGEIRKAEAYREQLSRPYTYVDKETGQTHTVAGIVLPPLRGKTTSGGGTSTGGSTGSGNVRTEDNPTSIKKAEKVASSIDTALSKVQEGKTAISQAMGLAPKTGFGAGWQMIAQNIPWTEPKALAGLVASLKSGKAIETLKELKGQSATGATGFGALNREELAIILNDVTTLDPTDKNFKTQLTTVLKGLERVEQELQKSRQGGGDKPPTDKLPVDVGGARERNVQKVMALYPKATREQVIQKLKEAGKY